MSQLTGIRCFLVEPVFGADSPDNYRDSWPPHKLIVGWTHAETGEQRDHLYRWGVGAMWRAIWMPRNWCWDNETEPHLIVRCPNGPEGETRDWDIDSRANNCKLPNDQVHRCWVRHGEAPILTVDKAGLTCAAGAGSIALPKWHGFLRNGLLVT